MACDLRRPVRGNPVKEGNHLFDIQSHFRWRRECAEISARLSVDVLQIHHQRIFCCKLKPRFKQVGDIILHLRTLVRLCQSRQGD